MALAACTAAATPSPTAAPTTAPTVAPSAAPTALPGTKSFTMVIPTPGLSSVPLLGAIDLLRSQGYTVDLSFIDAVELITQGVAKGDFAMGTTATNTIMVAVEKGAKLKAFVHRIANEHTLYVRKATIKACADLNGKSLGIHSEGAVSTFMTRNYLQTNCPGTTPQYLIIANSPNRAAAMIADKLDAATMEISDGIHVDAEVGDRFGLLSSYAQDLPNLVVSLDIVNTQWAETNPGTLLAFVKAILNEYRRIAGDPAAVQAGAEKYIKDKIDPKTIGAQAKRYTDLKMWDVNGGVTQAGLEYTHNFFGPSGAKLVGSGLKVSDWADLSILDLALKELGKK
jgi:ABC-type nitrate/sulfonate/bicarbonate transport system substrate-binding protein